MRCIFSPSQAFEKNTELKTFWLPTGIEPRTACLMHKRSFTELRQPVRKHKMQAPFRVLCILCFLSFYVFYVSIYLASISDKRD